MFNDKKTILYLITQSELGGAQKYIFDLVNYFKNNHDVHVGFGESGKNKILAQELKKINTPYIVLKNLKREINLISDLKSIYEINQLYKKIKPDIIHLNSTKISILGSLAAWFYKLSNIKNSPKIIYTAHGWVFNEPLSFFKKKFYLYAEKITAKLKDKIICVSDFDFQTALHYRICSSHKMTTIHNGSVAPIFLSKNEAEKELQKIINTEIQKYQIKIATISNFYPTKGLSYVIRAIVELKKNNLNPILIIFGEGPERKNLEKIIKQYQLENNIFLPGTIPGAAKYLKAFDFYVSPSLKEGLSYTITEAMHSGIPIIATNTGGTPEQIINNETGFLIETKNYQEIFLTIKNNFNNPLFGQQLLFNAQKRAKNEFALDKMLKLTNDIYFK